MRARACANGVPALALSLTLAMHCTHSATAKDSNEGRDALRACRAIAADAERLGCYDREVARLTPPSYAGRLGRITDPFVVEARTRLRYQSDGAIFVLYLKTATGEVLQNLHIGGGGEAAYVIEKPGTYVLDINGSESWRIWLEPAPENTIN